MKHKYYYTYKVQCTAVGWEDYYYLGKHVTSNLNDGYKGSGTKLREYYKQYPEDYTFTILAFYKDKTELSIAEQKLIGELWYTDKYCLNSTGGGNGGFKAASNYWKGRQLSEEHKKHISTGNKGKHLSDETKHKMSEARKGRKLSEEHKKRISIGNKLSELRKGKPSPRKGVKLTDETKHKMSEAHKGRKQSEIEIQNRINKIKGRKNPNCAVNRGKHRVYREDGTFYMSF